MNQNLLSFIIGYLIVINIVSISLVWLNVKTDIIKIKDKTLNWILVIISLLGGFIGTLVGAEMMGYKRESKIFKRLIPFLVFVEIFIILYLYAKK